MEVYSIGFTKTSAEDFFERLHRAGIKRLIDVRLNNISQLAGFAKRDDLAFFLRRICGADYIHDPRLAPTKEMLDEYKKAGGDWAEYERRFLDLMAARRVDETLDKSIFSVPTALLCSEHSAQHCHRRLVLEFLGDRWSDLEAVHL